MATKMFQSFGWPYNLSQNQNITAPSFVTINFGSVIKIVLELFQFAVILAGDLTPDGGNSALVIGF